MGRRDENKAEKHRRLVGGAAGLFRAQGYDRTTIEQIAQAAEVARGTFYLYFPDRLALFEALLDGWFDPLLDLLAEARAALDRAGSRAESRAIYEGLGVRIAVLALAHGDGVALALQELRNPGEAGEAVRRREAALVDVLVALTALASERGLIDAPDPRTDALIVLGGVERLAWQVLSGGAEGDPLAVAAEVVRLLSRGLGAG